MFDEISFVINGKLVLGLFKDSLLVRLGPDRAKAASVKPRVKETNMGGSPIKESVVIEPEGFDGNLLLSAWIQRAIEFFVDVRRAGPFAAGLGRDVRPKQGPLDIGDVAGVVEGIHPISTAINSLRFPYGIDSEPSPTRESVSEYRTDRLSRGLPSTELLSAGPNPDLGEHPREFETHAGMMDDVGACPVRNRWRASVLLAVIAQCRSPTLRPR